MKIFSAIKDCFSSRAARQERRMAALRDILMHDADAAAALQLADTQGVTLQTVPRAAGYNAMTHIMPGMTAVGVFIGETGDAADMAMSLRHELRHVEQFAALGLINTGYMYTVTNAGRKFFLDQLTEADAFTAETVAALRFAAAGKPQYLAANFKKEGPYRPIRQFVQENPPESFADEAGFARALFGELMIRGLKNYAARSFHEFHDIFAALPDVEVFRKVAAADEGVGKTAFTPALNKLYGGGFDVSALEEKYTATLSRRERAAIRLIDETVAAAAELSADDYAAQRKKILDTCSSIFKDTGFSIGFTADKDETALQATEDFLALCRAGGQAVSLNSSRPISMRRISDVPAPIS